MAPQTPLQHLSAQQPHGGADVLVNLPQHEGETPLHEHDFLEIAIVLEGQALHRTIQGLAPVAAGDALVLLPGQWHAYERCRGLKLANCGIGLGVMTHELAWTLQDPQISALWPRSQAGISLRRVGAGQEVGQFRLPPDRLAAVVQEMSAVRQRQTGPSPALHRPEVIARTLLILAQVAAALPRTIRTAVDDMPPELQDLKERIEEDLDHPWGLEEMARQAQVSRFHLVRRFRRHLGEPPMAWLARRRLERAAVLLMTTDLPIAEVGARVGWSDANFFARRFRARFQQTPRAYRASLPVPALPRAGEDWIQW